MSMEKLTVEDFKNMLRNALACITERADEFSRLDAVLGDGDHGTAIVQAMSAIVGSAEKGTEFKSMLNDMGFNVMLQISGSTSTLLGGLFLGMSDHAEGTELDAAAVKAMFAGGLEGVRKQTKAQRGDKTMMDALIPAVQTAQQTQGDCKAILEAAAQAAHEGAKASEQFVSKFGRARSYKEQTIGTPDAGAVSTALFFRGLAQGI